MSRALALAERRKLDAYYTPDDLAEALVQRLPIGWHDVVLEPSVGGGAFARALKRGACRRVVGIDVDDQADGLLDCDLAHVGDFLEQRFAGRVEWVVGNPPYRDAEAHVRRALEVTMGSVAFLLRLGFLESSKRADLWACTPLRKVWVLQERPSFTGGGTDSAAYGFFWWDLSHRGPAEVDWLSWRAPR